MKRIPTQQNSFLKRFLINIPFVLIVFVIVVALAAGVTFGIYGVVTAIAFHSAMISLIVFGAGFLSVGVGLGFIVLFKKYYAFYDKKMGWYYPDKVSDEQKSAVYNGKKPLRSYFTLTNISLAVLLLGAICTIVSAALGCVDRGKWVDAMRPFKQEHGYFDDIKEFDVRQIIQGFNENDVEIEMIECDLCDKIYEVKYVDDAEAKGTIRFFTYYRFDGQLTLSRKGNAVKIVEKERDPIVRDALAKMLFFVTDVMSNYPPEHTIVIEIPESYREKIEVVKVNDAN